MRLSEQIAHGHAYWVEGYVEKGWTPYILTFNFRQLSGSPNRVAVVMRAEIERAFSIFVTRANRRPRSKHQRGNLPIWICCYDFPVPKLAKQSKYLILPNEGAHCHATLLMPPFSRIEDVVAHFTEGESIYCRPESPLRPIHCKQVTSRPGYVHAYVMKAMLNGRVSADEWFVLPKSLSEL